MNYNDLKAKELQLLAVEKLGITKTKARGINKAALVSALEQLDVADVQSDSSVAFMLTTAQAADVVPPVRGGEVEVARVSGVLGQTFTVRRDPNGVIWCDCGAWVRSERALKTCPHMAQLVGDGELSSVYDMTAEEILEANQLLRTPEASKGVWKFTRIKGPSSSGATSVVGLADLFGKLRKLGICCALGVATLAGNIEYATARNKRGLVVTLKGAEHAGVVYFNGLTVGNSEFAVELAELFAANGFSFQVIGVGIASVSAL